MSTHTHTHKQNADVDVEVDAYVESCQWCAVKIRGSALFGLSFPSLVFRWCALTSPDCHGMLPERKVTRAHVFGSSNSYERKILPNTPFNV